MKSSICNRMPGWLAAIGLLYLLGIAGCATHHEDPQVMVTPLTTYSNAAKGPECAMPVLAEQPGRSYRQVAIVEGWGDFDQGAQVIEAARRKACETGADALLVLSAKGQRVVKSLYGVTPNTKSEESASADAAITPGHYIHYEEYKPQPGEAGHTGYYLDMVAIVFTNNSDKPNLASGSPGN
ncbi:MAG: hypothetical protein IVW54_16330 [Candidatus Binataceae bacterium]|nr:hypothetical protein [Candidatus Binataceae bacterium]